VTTPPAAADDPGGLLRRARARPLLPAAEQARLARSVRRGDTAARERMIEGNLRLVVAVARSHRGRGVPFADLVQEGAIGLMQAVERFDPGRGARFSTYAVPWIRRAMLDAIVAGPPIRIPAGARRRLAAVRRAEAELRRAGPPAVSAESIAAVTGLSAQTVGQLRTAARVSASLDDPVGEDGTSLGDLVADGNAPDPAERAIAVDQLRAVSRMLGLLPDRHREVLVRRYGLDGSSGASHRQIGERLGVGAERSRQIEHAALQRLRTAAGPALRAA
jgi:RNA polymerase sigma factor (sigma-70 family)